MEEVIKLHFGGYLSFVDRLRHYCYSIRGLFIDFYWFLIDYWFIIDLWSIVYNFWRLKSIIVYSDCSLFPFQFTFWFFFFFSHFFSIFKGQGWVWVLEEEGNISIEVSHQYQHPIARSANIKPLLALDMWEHSYYLDYLHKVDVCYLRNFCFFWKFHNFYCAVISFIYLNSFYFYFPPK